MALSGHGPVSTVPAVDTAGVGSGSDTWVRIGERLSRPSLSQTGMTAVDNLWYLADQARQQAEQTRHQFASNYEDYSTFSRHRSVSRPRFKTVAERTRDNGLPYGVHTVVTNDTGEVLLVRHDDVDMWVLPGGQVDGTESFREAASRELREEAGIEATDEGLAILARAEFHCAEYDTWGVLPMFHGRAVETELTVDDPDGEISDAGWFDELPEDTRDREQLREWREKQA